jgi:hypothetical protein
MKTVKILIEQIEDIRQRSKERNAPEVEQLALFKTNMCSPHTLEKTKSLLAKRLGSPANSQKEKAQSKRRNLLPIRHLNRDFFLCDLFDYAIKDDGASMEAPIFTLATKPDLTEWHWESKDGSRSITVTPSVKGRATQFDKDVLIYVISQMTEALNRDRSDAKRRVVQFTVYDYLITTNKQTGGKEYQRLEGALERLRGTTIKTDIKTGNIRIKEGFGLIERWKIVERSPNDERMIAVEITLSEWLYNAVQAREVLTINPNYFRLRKPIERRLYELARKHCGHQTLWAINLDLLQSKVGSKSSRREFRRIVQEIIEFDALLDYRITLDKHTDKITFYTKDISRLATSLSKHICSNTPFK